MASNIDGLVRFVIFDQPLAASMLAANPTTNNNRLADEKVNIGNIGAKDYL
jgi:hypothetical protein